MMEPAAFEAKPLARLDPGHRADGRYQVMVAADSEAADRVAGLVTAEDDALDLALEVLGA